MKHLKTFETFNTNESITGLKINKEDLKNYYVYSWYEERGELDIYVINAGTDEIVYQFNSKNLEGEDKENFNMLGFDLIEDGFMEDLDDVAGLSQHLKNLKIIPADAHVLSEAEFENANIVDEIQEKYKYDPYGIMDYLKSKCTKWEKDCDNKEDTEKLVAHLEDKFPKVSKKELYNIAKIWTGYEEKKEEK